MRWVLCLMMLAAFGFAPAPVYRPNKNDADQEKLQGDWKGTGMSLRRKGMKNVEYLLRECPSLLIRGNAMTLVLSDKSSTKFEMKLDAAGKEIALQVGESPLLWHAMYRIEGDELTVCLSNDSGTRPTSTEGGRMVTVMNFKRSPKP